MFHFPTDAAHSFFFNITPFGLKVNCSKMNVLNIEEMKFLKLGRKSRKGGRCILFYAEHLLAVHRKDLFVDGL